MTQLSGETEIKSLSGSGVKVTLTNKRVYQESSAGEAVAIKIIPLQNIDSFEMTTSQKPWLLIVGILLALCGLLLLLNQGDFNNFGVLLLLAGGGMIIAWSSTKKIGAFIYSFSGVTPIFIQASANNKEAVMKFVDEIQKVLETYRHNAAIMRPTDHFVPTTVAATAINAVQVDEQEASLKHEPTGRINSEGSVQYPAQNEATGPKDEPVQETHETKKLYCWECHKVLSEQEAYYFLRRVYCEKHFEKAIR